MSKNYNNITIPESDWKSPHVKNINYVIYKARSLSSNSNRLNNFIELFKKFKYSIEYDKIFNRSISKNII